MYFRRVETLCWKDGKQVCLYLEEIRSIQKSCPEMMIAEEKRMHQQKQLTYVGVTALYFYQELSNSSKLTSGN